MSTRRSGDDESRSAAPGATRRGAVLVAMRRTTLRTSVTVAVLVAAATMPLLVADSGVLRSGNEAAAAALMVLLAVVNVELGRWVERRTHAGQTSHKTLSVWAFATVLSVDPAWLLAVVPLAYAYAWVRGLRVPVGQWVNSASFVMLAGCGAALLLATQPPGSALDPSKGVAAPALLLAAAAVFLVVETALFLAKASLDDAREREVLRGSLHSIDFYRTELSVLALAGLSVLIIAKVPVFAPLLIALFVVVQQAVVFVPLHREAKTDEKTGLLRYEPWRVLANYRRQRHGSRGTSWALLFIDLDNFKAYNDTYGHLAGDVALLAVARALQERMRPDDLLCRFGGEEFAALVAAEPADAMRVADRLRVHVAMGAQDAGAPVTVSIGVAAVRTRGPSTQVPDLAAVLVVADRALYDAKRGGRNRVVAHEVT